MAERAAEHGRDSGFVRGPGPGVAARPGFVAAVAAVLLLWGLGGIDLWAPDEPRYAQVAEEVRALERGPGDAILLHLNGAPYSQKPPLYYWLAAAFGSWADRVGETAARLPSALAGVALVVLTFALGGRMFGPGAGWWSAGVLLSVYRFDHLARRAQLDVLLALLETVALWAFWRLDRDRAAHPAHRVLLHAALGLAVLTKGPVGLLPLAIGAVYLAWEGRAGDMRRMLPAWGWLLSLGPGLAWIGAALWLAPPGFFGEAVVENVFGRFFAGTSHARPFYYYLYQLPADFLPWTLVLPWALWSWRRGGDTAPRGGAPGEQTARRFLGAWILLPLVFFSLSAGKRGLYLLPVFPALAIVCGSFVHTRLRDRPRLPRGVALALGATGAVLAAAGLALLAAGGFDVPGAEVRIPPGLGAWIAAAVAIGWSLPVLARAAGREVGAEARAAAALGAWLAVLLAVFTLAYPALDREKSPRPLARAARALAGPGGAVGVFDYTSLVGGIVYYGGRPVVELPDEAAARRFVDAGHHVVVARARHEDRLRAVADVRVAHRQRSGSRELLVLELGEAAGEGTSVSPADP